MKKCILLFLLVVHVPAFSQFAYSAWNIGPQLGSFHITNGIAQYQTSGINATDARLVDSATTNYSVTNLRFNIEDIRTNRFVKAYMSLPLGKHAEHDSVGILGKSLEAGVKFGFGFNMGEHVGLQFGLNGGICSVKQYDDPSVPAGATRFDYFVPSAGSTPLYGEHMFGNMSVFQGGILVSNVIAFTDNIALQTTLSHNGLKLKKETIHGSNNELEFAFYYSNPDMHNLGFRLGVTENWMHFKGYTVEDAAADGDFNRVYPASKVKMTTFYIGVNFPIVFSRD